MTTDQIIEAVARRAASDSAFRQLALTDADAAVETVAGPSALASGAVVFVATGDAHSAGRDARVVTLPEAADDLVEMEEADLEQVAGGCQMGCSYPDSNDPMNPIGDIFKKLPGGNEDFYI